MFSDAEEVPSVVSPFDVKISLAKIFPQISSLVAEHRRTLTRPSSTSGIKATSPLKKFHREVEQEKVYYDHQLHQVAMEFVDFYAKNFRDDFGDTENHQDELQTLFGLIVAAIALGEMSVAQLASQPNIVVSILQRLQKVEEVKNDRCYQDAYWFYHLRALITSLNSVFKDFLWDAEGEGFNNSDSEEFFNSEGFYENKTFVTEPAEGVALLLSPSKLTQANKIVRKFANELLVCGSVVLELSQTGVIMSGTGAWRELLGLVLRIACLSIFIPSIASHPNPLLGLGNSSTY